MTPDRTPRLAGGCQCGAVRYELYALPEQVHLCHCRMCQRAVGNAFAALAPVRKADVAFTQGSPRTFRSSSIAERGFCGDCGTPLTFSYVEGDWMNVTLGSLDSPDAAPPAFHYGVESRLAWLDHIADLPQRGTDTGGVSGTAGQTMVSYQAGGGGNPKS